MDFLSGAMSFGGGLLQNMFSQKSAKDAQFFSQHMRDTAYRAGMKDMRLAGLNPILAYQKGPASAPSGTPFAATDPITPAVNSAMASHRLKYEVENMKETNKQIAQSTATNREQEALTEAQKRLTNSQISINEQIYQTALREARKAKTDDEFYSSPIGRVMRTIGTGVRELNPFNVRNPAGRQ